jgi:hypothetical protein
MDRLAASLKHAREVCGLPLLDVSDVRGNRTVATEQLAKPPVGLSPAGIRRVVRQRRVNPTVSNELSVLSILFMPRLGGREPRKHLSRLGVDVDVRQMLGEERRGGTVPTPERGRRVRERSGSEKRVVEGQPRRSPTSAHCSEGTPMTLAPSGSESRTRPASRTTEATR